MILCQCFENLEEMNTFPEKYNLPKLTQEEIEYQNSPVAIKENESII